MPENPNFYQDLFNLPGQVQGNPQPQTDWLWSNQNVPQMPQNYGQPQSYGTDYEAYLKGEGFNPNVDEKGNLVGNPTQGIPSSITDQYTREEYVQMRNEAGYDSTTAGEEWDKANTGGSKMGANEFLNKLPFLSGTGTDIGTELFMTGNALGTDKGTPGRGLAIASGIGAAVLGGARAGLSGFALAKANETQAEWERKQLAKGRQGSYTPAPQYGNTNNLGGQMFAEGGLFNDPPTKPIPAIWNYKPNLGAEYATDLERRLKEYESNPKQAGTDIPDYGSGSADRGSPTGTGGNYRVLTDAERAAKIAEIEALNPEDLRPDIYEAYVNLRKNTGYHAADLNLNKIVVKPFDLRTLPVFQPKAQQTPPAAEVAPVTSDPTVGYARSANTGQLMPERSNIGESGDQFITDRQYSQYLEEFANDPSRIVEKQQREQQIATNRELLTQMTEEQKAEARALKLTPDVYLKSKGLMAQTFDNGGEMQGNQYGALFQDTNADPIVKFNKSVGDVVEFEAAGKQYKGKIKKIENGKFFI